MEGSEEKHLLKALGRMRKACRIIRNCFLGAEAIFLIFWIMLIASSVSNQLSVGGIAMGSLAYMIAYGAFAVLLLWNLSMLFQEVVKGSMPFSDVQADRLRAIAVIALGFVALDILMSFGFVYEPLPELGFGMVVNDGIAKPTLNLNIGMLAFSAIMYSLSAIFRYAALLQQLSDETV